MGFTAFHALFNLFHSFKALSAPLLLNTDSFSHNASSILVLVYPRHFFRMAPFSNLKTSPAAFSNIWGWLLKWERNLNIPHHHSYNDGVPDNLRGHTSILFLGYLRLHWPIIGMAAKNPFSGNADANAFTEKALVTKFTCLSKTDTSPFMSTFSCCSYSCF